MNLKSTTLISANTAIPKIKSADFIISITRNALKEETEALVSSYIQYMAITFIKIFWTTIIGEELTCEHFVTTQQ